MMLKGDEGPGQGGGFCDESMNSGSDSSDPMPR